MAITPEYTRRAIRNYNSKFDRVAVNLPKGSKERIKELTSESCNAYISKLVMEDLIRLEQSGYSSKTVIQEMETVIVPSEEEIQPEETPAEKKAEATEVKEIPKINKNLKEIEIPAFLRDYNKYTE